METTSPISEEEPIGQALDDYIRDKHTQQECIGFIDGYKSARTLANKQLEEQKQIESCEKALSERDRIIAEKDKEIENLLSVMVAAAEEIQEHWQAHCDEDGYGPSNLMHRLENGIAANYPGYKPGAFANNWEQISRLQEALRSCLVHCEGNCPALLEKEIEQLLK